MKNILKQIKYYWLKGQKSNENTLGAKLNIFLNNNKTEVRKQKWKECTQRLGDSN